MIILDTNVLSEFLRPTPSADVIAWMDAQPRSGMAVSAVTAFEMLHGVARLPEGPRRQRLAEAVTAQLAAFGRRVLPFDAAAAAHAAELTAERQRTGHPIAVQDAQIAGIARSRGFALATRNTWDFLGTGVNLIDPWSL